MNGKREARLRYYDGIRSAMLDHAKVTEEGLRKLEGIKPAKLEEMVAELHKEHEKLLKRIDRYIKQEKAS